MIGVVLVGWAALSVAVSFSIAPALSVEPVDRPLAPGRARFVAKRCGDTWGVYDVARASFPMARPGLGMVEQQHGSEAAAQVEADRLNTLVGVQAH